MKKENNRKTAEYDEKNPSSEDICDYPETTFEQITKFGTYEIQPTADTANWFPAIAQGLPTQPTGRNQRLDKTKSKLHDNGKLWSKDNKNERD